MRLEAKELSAKCRRFSAAVSGLNYHRSEANEITSGQIWRFEDKGRLLVFPAGHRGLSQIKKSNDAQWAIEAEDERCVIKVTGTQKPGQTLTFRITDTTWAIVKIRGEDKHIPDFEDHTGMKTRYCGVGDRCEKLWK